MNINLRIILLSILLLHGCEQEDGSNDNASTGLILAIVAAGAVAAISSSGGDDSTSTSSSSEEETEASTSIVKIFSIKNYDGSTNDLLTGGLGHKGLTGPVPSAVDPVNPTATEIRTAAIANQYKATIDMRISSGYGSLYGPATDKSTGKIAGTEYLAYGTDNTTMLLQLPSNFDRLNPCLVVAPTPGVQNIYGSIGTVGEWGLKKRCAVTYTDKSGTGIHDLYTDTVNIIDGTRTTSKQEASFIAKGTAKMDLASYNSTYPYRIAQKYSHSKQNPEANWDTNVLDTIEFAFEVLNLEDSFGEAQTITVEPSNTIVIAAGTSGGGAASLRAMEKDNKNLIDGIVVASPIINVSNTKSFLDIITYYNIFQLCASANTTNGLIDRCTALYNAGLLTQNTLQTRISRAKKILSNYGIAVTSITHNYVDMYANYANLYANAYGKFSVTDNLCGYSYAKASGNDSLGAKTLADLADDFQTSGFPASGTYLINNLGNDGEGINYMNSIDANGKNDGYLQGTLCLRQLVTGKTIAGVSLTDTELENSNRVTNGLQETLATGDLQGKPAIIIHGRDDPLAHVNFTSQAYYKLNKRTQTDSKLVYLEVTNANHIDGLNQTYNVKNQIPLQYYLHKALDTMYQHLKNKTKLPYSQVIATVPNSSLKKRLPDFNSDKNCEIKFSDNTLKVPKC